ncbi:MAG TPA: glycosyltransferase family 9 protein [Chthoniobacterales bacterium]|nr:glycosyltransferase family 9 protein [Chthoniobacterales bacterium]
MKRLLVIRGGAIGDFVLTLPAVRLLRDAFPGAQLEIVGLKHIAVLAAKRFYADAVRSIESPSLSRFFAEGAELPGELCQYFGSFDLIVSYLYDPDRIFERNVGKCSRGVFVAGPAKLDTSAHAAVQLAGPLERLGLELRNPAARLYPSDADRAAVAHLRQHDAGITIHPGSGGETKNWPLENWRELGALLLSEGHALTVVGGEADRAQTSALKQAWRGEPVQFAENLPLPHLAALLEDQLFVGHDSGISHIAAAVGARCVLLFGPTNPAIWAPANEDVTVVCAPGGNMRELDVAVVARVAL